jgi:entericidin B
MANTSRAIIPQAMTSSLSDWAIVFFSVLAMEPAEPAFVAMRQIYRERDKPSMKTQTYAVVAMLASVLLVSACANTIRGVGKDAAGTVDATQNAGKRVSNAAQ